MGNRDRLAEGELFPLDLWRLSLEEQAHDACSGTDAQPPDVAFDQAPTQTSTKEPTGDVVDETDHLGPSDL